MYLFLNNFTVSYAINSYRVNKAHQFWNSLQAFRKKRGWLIFFKEFISLTNQSAKHFQRTGPKDIAHTPRRLAAKFFSVKTSPLIAAMLQSQMVTSAAQFPSDSPALQSIENSFQSLPFYFSLVKPEMLLGRGSGISIHSRRRQINCLITNIVGSRSCKLPVARKLSPRTSQALWERNMRQRLSCKLARKIACQMLFV